MFIRRHIPKIQRYRPEIKIYKLKWEFHQYDDDPWPSVPHGHALEADYVLQLWSGNVYHKITRRYIGRASKKEISKLKKILNYKGSYKLLESIILTSMGIVQN